MKHRVIIGKSNWVGANIERLRKALNISQKDFVLDLKRNGLYINSTSYSKLEGQTRIATDKEIYVIAKILGVSLEELFK